MSADPIGAEAGAEADAPNTAAALVLVEALGVRVFPLYGVRLGGACACGNAACKNVGKHPMLTAWQLAASSDPAAVRAMFKRAGPMANIGAATDQRSTVIDIDGELGRAVLADLEAEHGPLPATVTTRTHRGHHFEFTSPVPILCSAGKLGKGFDVRGIGGYRVAVGSTHESGHRYAYESGLGPDAMTVAELPAWLVALLVDPPSAPSGGPGAAFERPALPVSASRAERWADGALAAECNAVRSAPEGTRNATLNTAAFNLGMMVGGGALDGGLVRRSLHAAALAAGLGELEALKTIKSGMAAGIEKDQRTGPGRDAPGFVPMLAGGTGMVPEPPGPAEPSAPSVAVPPSAMSPRYDTAAIFAPLPEQRWCVPGLQIGPGRPTMIAGYGASAKTIAAQSLALSCASGRPIWGRFECSPMVVLHVDYEQGYFATAKRYQRVARGSEITVEELGNRLHYVEMPRVYLDQRGGEAEFMAACEGVDLIIVDALRGAAPHSDENDSAFRAVVDALTFVSQRTGVSVIILHHAGKPKKDASADARTVPRGSSAIFDACGCVLNFVAVPGSAARLVTQVKTPAEAEGRALDPFELIVEDVTINGDSTAGARVTWRPPPVVDVAAEADLKFEHDAAIVLRAVGRSPDGQSSNEVVARSGLRRTRTLDVVRALADRGRLEVTTRRRGAKFYRLPSDGVDHD